MSAETKFFAETESAHPVVSMGPPELRDGAALWQLARDSGSLDLNSSYSYLLWCRDFAATSIVARDHDSRVLGFVTGYVRPGLPDTLMVWQVAVAESARGHGLATRMLTALMRRRVPHGQTRLETTITLDNSASIALFTALGREHGAGVSRTELFRAALFPDGHADEVLFRVGPFTAAA